MTEPRADGAQVERAAGRHDRADHRRRRIGARLMRVATLRQGPAVLSEAGAHLLPMPVGDLIGLGLGRALEVGAAALAQPPVGYLEADLLLPYKPPSVRDFVTFES